MTRPGSSPSSSSCSSSSCRRCCCTCARAAPAPPCWPAPRGPPLALPGRDRLPASSATTWRTASPTTGPPTNAIPGMHLDGAYRWARGSRGLPHRPRRHHRRFRRLRLLRHRPQQPRPLPRRRRPPRRLQRDPHLRRFPRRRQRRRPRLPGHRPVPQLPPPWRPDRLPGGALAARRERGAADPAQRPRHRLEGRRELSRRLRSRQRAAARDPADAVLIAAGSRLGNLGAGELSNRERALPVGGGAAGAAGDRGPAPAPAGRPGRRRDPRRTAAADRPDLQRRGARRPLRPGDRLGAAGDAGRRAVDRGRLAVARRRGLLAVSTRRHRLRRRQATAV